MDPNVIGAFVGAVVAIVEEDEREAEETLRLVARIAAAEIVEFEEGVPFDEDVSWVPVSVNIDEYHAMPDHCFKLHFRMGRGTFEALTAALHNHLTNTGRLKRERTPFQDIVLMVIWLLATPDCFRSVALRFGVRPSTLYYFYSYIIEALRELAPQYISWPDDNERREIEATFRRATGFPGVVGCIDGTHIDVTAPLHDPAAYINRHHTYSMNVQAVVDSTLLVRDLHVGEPGSIHDKRVFSRSPLGESLLHGQGIRPDEHLVGDGGYILTNFIMIPFANNGHLTPQQIQFNKSLSQSRVRVENSFALAKGKWRRLKFLHARNAAIVVDHITACFVLHNFMILNGEVLMEEEELAREINNNQVLGNHVEGEEENGDDELLRVAKDRGEIKRNMIMEEILDNL